MHCPNGHTLETLMQSKAGRVYMAARIVPTERETYSHAIDYVLGFGEAPEIAQTCNPPHPECYAYMFDDNSVLVVSNADDEVWTSETDYMEAYDLHRADHSDYGWAYVPTVEPMPSSQWHAYANAGAAI